MGMFIRPFTLSDLASFHRTLDAVARERRYLALLEAPPIADTERYLRTALEQGAIHFVAEDDGRVVGWCDITPRQQPGSSHIGDLGMGYCINAAARVSVIAFSRPPCVKLSPKD